ncbi:MAG: ABC transporter ATP-binding protein [Halanaerobiales bacterium]
MKGEKNISIIKTFKRLGNYGKSHLGKIIIAASAVLLSIIMGLIPPWLIKYGIDNYIMKNNIEKLWIIALIMIIVTLLKGLFDFIKSYVSEYIAQNIIHDIRVELYEHLNKLSFSFYDSAKTGDLMSRITSDADSLRRFLANVSVYVSSNILTILGILIVMFIWDYRLGILYIGLIPLMVFGMRIYAIRVRPMFKRVRKSFASLTHFLRENFIGMEVIKLFGREKYEKNRFKKKNQKYISINLEAAKVSAFWMPYVNFLMGLGTSLVVWYGGRLVIGKAITLGTLAGFISYISMLLRPVRQTGMMIDFSSQAAAAAERIFEVMDKKSEVKEFPEAHDINNVKGKVEYKNLNFSYDKKKKVLKDINLEVDAGDTVAIVGPTGAGKSTLIHLLPRFYDPDQGEILIDGENIKNLTLESLRNQVGIVLQHTFLFAASVKENISYGRPEANIEDIKKAAKIAQIHDFISSLPLGYETPIGERGVNLSGGQKQRLAMARVLLTDPALLILDEPTSSIDASTEEKMQKALKEVIKNRTTFVIAHRLWTVKNADKIIVIKDGEIVEKGKHEELLQRDGFYSEVHNKLEQSNVDTNDKAGVN